MTAAGAEELVEFLLARIAEDEAEAIKDRDTAQIDVGRPDRAVAEGIRRARWARAPRVLADCEAKRRIVAGLTGVLAQSRQPEQRQNAETTLRHLAAVYADHPDYRDEWRP